MIDVESQIFNRIATKLRAEYPAIGNAIYGEARLAPAQFPSVCIEEAENSVYSAGADSGAIENFATVMYEVNVFSNKRNGKKAEAKEIFQIIDLEFEAMGFTRVMRNCLILTDATMCRIIARYTAVVSSNEVIFRR